MYLKINNLNIYYEKYGNKKSTIVILPGWGDTRLTFNYLINYLKDYFTIYILDYPGFGNSSIPESDLTIYEYVSLIERFLTKLDIKEPIIIAHSFGGRITSILSERVKLKKLLLIDVAGIKHKDIKLLLRNCLYKFLKKLGYLLPKKVREKYLKLLFNKFSSSDYKALDKRLLKTFQNVVKEDLTKYYKNITLETLILWGENDDITPLKDGIKINKLIKDSVLIPIANTSHFPYLDKNNLVLKIILAYLKKDIRV